MYTRSKRHRTIPRASAFDLAVGMAGLIIAGMVVLGTASSAAAQSTSVVIADGRVSVNGQVLADEDVPAALRSFDGEVSFSFTGQEDPLLGLGDKLYRIEADRIVEVEEERGVQAIHSAMGHPRIAYSTARWRHPDSSWFDFELPDVDVFRGSVLDSARVMIRRFALDEEDLRRQAERMQLLAEEMRRTVPPPGGRIRVFGPGSNWGERDELEFGRLEAESLRRHLSRERELDVESRRLARELIGTTSQELRSEIESELRAHLEEEFALRQENRQAEIRELEQRLEELRDRLARRAELRDRIIDERLEFLKEEARGRER